MKTSNSHNKKQKGRIKCMRMLEVIDDHENMTLRK